MKKHSLVKKGLLLGAFCIALAFTPASIYGQNHNANPDNNGWGNASDNGDSHASDRGNERGVGHQNVGAPLDGGILTLLIGGLSVAYAARKRRKISDN